MYALTQCLNQCAVAVQQLLLLKRTRAPQPGGLQKTLASMVRWTLPMNKAPTMHARMRGAHSSNPRRLGLCSSTTRAVTGMRAARLLLTQQPSFICGNSTQRMAPRQSTPPVCELVHVKLGIGTRGTGPHLHVQRC